jgi:hypothetical protein
MNIFKFSRPDLPDNPDLLEADIYVVFDDGFYLNIAAVILAQFVNQYVLFLHRYGLMSPADACRPIVYSFCDSASWFTLAAVSVKCS